MSFPPEIVNEILEYCDFAEYTLYEIYGFFDFIQERSHPLHCPIIGLNKEKIEGIIMYIENDDLQADFLVDNECKNIQPKFARKLTASKIFDESLKRRLISFAQETSMIIPPENEL